MKKRIAVLAFALACVPRMTFAQDSNYWNLQYGTRGDLLSGVVVGSALDMSATFYNPGSVAYVQNPTFILTASVFGMQTIKVLNQEPDEEAVNSTRFGPLPSMVAGLLPMKWFGGRTGYSMLTRQQFDFRMAAREGVVIGRDEPGDTLSTGGEVNLTQNMGETWGGFTWAKKLGARAAVGTTIYGAYRGQYTRQTQDVESLSSSGFGAAYMAENEIDFWNARLLAKLGVYFDLGRGTVGMSFTTPSANVMGSGTVVANKSVIGDANGDGIDDSQAEVGFAEGLDTEFKSPMSVAVGGSYKFKRMTGHATMEYFAPIDQYTVVHAPAPAGSPGVTGIEITYQGAATSVVNWGAGIEQGFGDDSSFYVSFITDRTSYQAVDDRRIVLSTWDIYQLSGGVALTVKGSEVTLGGGYAWGSNEPVTEFSDGTAILPATIVPGGVTYKRLKFIIGFAL